MRDKILILAPHTDDGEFACGGTIAKFVEEGKEVFYMAFSTCQASIPEGMPKDILKKELLSSMEHYKIKNENIIIKDYPVRNFNLYRQSILDDMIIVNKAIKPSMVLMPSLNDIHQDHSTISHEALRAFKKTSLLGYELPWNNFTFNNQTFIKLELRHVQKKIEAIKLYESQLDRDYADPEYITGLARAHGVQIGVQFAEVFETVRWII